MNSVKMKAFRKSKHSIMPNVFAVRQRVFDAENMNVCEYRRFRFEFERAKIKRQKTTDNAKNKNCTSSESAKHPQRINRTRKLYRRSPITIITHAKSSKALINYSRVNEIRTTVKKYIGTRRGPQFA